MNYWLSVVAPDLHEGAHYSVMFYGGKLLSSCDAKSDDPSDELVSLFRLHTHFCVLMDSDKKTEDDSLSATKTRIIDECKRSGCMSLVTHGKTVENYVPSELLEWAIHEVHGDTQYDGVLDDKYKGPLDSTFHGVSTRPNKNKIARVVVERGFDLVTELRAMIVKLAGDIRRVNALPDSEEL